MNTSDELVVSEKTCCWKQVFLWPSALSELRLAESGTLLGELRKEEELERTDSSWQGAELGSDLCGTKWV